MVERINSTEHGESPDPESEMAKASFATKESDENTTQTLPNGDAPAALSTILLDDRFRIIREIARGGIGIAYLASDSQAQDRLVVVKALLEQPDPRYKSWVERHFREEVKALGRIDHPGIVKLVTSGELPDGRPYIAMEFVEGSTLRSHIEPEVGLGDPIRIANFIRKLGQAISAAHDAGVYHRDLKPENIMLCAPQQVDGEEEIKVIDFGISIVKDALDAKTRSTLPAGSVRYMSPEQLSGKVTRLSDIYAFGLIAYEVITGRLPFNPDEATLLRSAQRLLEMQAAGVRVRPRDLRPSIPNSADEAILKALSYDPAKRFQRADEFGEQLAVALTPRETNPDVHAETIHQQTGVAVRTTTRMALVIFAVTALVASLVSFGWWYFKSNKAGAGLGVAGPAASGESQNKVRSLGYWGLLQPYRSGRPAGPATKLAGGIAGETFYNSGDAIQFFVTSSHDGHLYLINRESSGRYNLIFPSPEANSKSSELKANAVVSTSECQFDARAGTETVWIVWSAREIEELETSIRRWANASDQGEIREDATTQFINRLLQQGSSARPQVEPDVANERINLRSEGDVIVHSLKLIHR